MTGVATSFRITAIPPEMLDRLREQGNDDFGNPLNPFMDSDGGSPLRCCLRPSSAGEQLALIAYRPFAASGPYAEVGPVFIHADHCEGYAELSKYPAGYRDSKPMIFRPYRYDGAMAYPSITMAGGGEAEETIDQIFGDPTIEVIHTRNVLAGCYMFAIRRG